MAVPEPTPSSKVSPSASTTTTCSGATPSLLPRTTLTKAALVPPRRLLSSTPMRTSSGPATASKRASSLAISATSAAATPSVLGNTHDHDTCGVFEASGVTACVPSKTSPGTNTPLPNTNSSRASLPSGTVSAASTSSSVVSDAQIQSSLSSARVHSRTAGTRSSEKGTAAPPRSHSSAHRRADVSSSHDTRRAAVTCIS
mmetsp:Transcript_10249/g.35819  ORF Transcript_10249/g.35819 Transcript_10249/m.35819 type:complete len:200 (-) Transcript_10249:1418-2017(-)